MQGHVDGLGTVREVHDDGFARWVTVAAPPDLLRYVVEKGSIAVDGISLTVAAVDATSFSVSLIPETLARTTLGEARPGAPVNLEVDVMAKYAEKLLAGRLDERARVPRPRSRGADLRHHRGGARGHRRGRFVVVVDDEDRENEGDLVMAAEHVTPTRSTSWPPTPADGSASRSRPSAATSSTSSS
jgi:hypothetical protein